MNFTSVKRKDREEKLNAFFPIIEKNHPTFPSIPFPPHKITHKHTIKFLIEAQNLDRLLVDFEKMTRRVHVVERFLSNFFLKNCPNFPFLVPFLSLEKNLTNAPLRFIFVYLICNFNKK